jgi:hypothetical protein
MIGLGRLVDFIIRDAQGRRLRVTPTDERWLAWRADTRDLLVLKPGRAVDCALHPHAALRHRVFHGADPQSVREMDWPTSRGNRRELGLIESVTYTAVGIHSPSKGSHLWIHHFGDGGERQHGPIEPGRSMRRDQKLLPFLESDRFGSLFVVRQRSNKYFVNEWIIW